MNTLLLILIASTAAVVLAYIGRQLALVIKGDGYGSRLDLRVPPRSHVPDQYEPRFG